MEILEANSEAGEIYNDQWIKKKFKKLNQKRKADVENFNLQLAALQKIVSQLKKKESEMEDKDKMLNSKIRENHLQLNQISVLATERGNGLKNKGKHSLLVKH